MLLRAGDDDTICALSTPPGLGGVALLRISGKSALAVARKLCAFLPQIPESHRLYFGVCRSSSSAVTVATSGFPSISEYNSKIQNEPIDQVLVSFFANGRSFTGEETVEISCHGGSVLAGVILKELIDSGARLATPGEFTYRAFMNGKLDLVQAESVLSLIESQSRQTAKAAFRQLQGGLSQEFAEIENDLVWILAHLEASIDFSTEGIEVVPSIHLSERAMIVQQRVAVLLNSYKQGKLLKEGLEIAIVGRPNAGKSSLLNAFLREDRAIVTPYAGTTRDTIEGRVLINGILITFVDTAGLRDTDDEIEKLGIERSRVALKRADLVFHVIDILDPVAGLAELEFSESCFYLVNKSDLGMGNPKALRDVLIARGADPGRIFNVSAKDRSGVSEVELALDSLLKDLDVGASNLVMQARHFELLQKIHSCLNEAIELIKSDESPEFIAFELQEGVRAIHSLLGKKFDEQVIDRIFKEFCLGK